MKYKINYNLKSIDLDIPDEKVSSYLTYPDYKGETVKYSDLLSKLIIPQHKIIGVVINDLSRKNPHQKYLPAFIKKIKEFQPQIVKFFIANGTHEIITNTAKLQKQISEIADEVGIKYSVFTNECDDKEKYINLGKTSFGTDILILKEWMTTEIRIYLHESKPHYMSGYSLIDKQMLPGLSARESTVHNHKFALDEHSGPGRTYWNENLKDKNNPFSIDNVEFRHKTEKYQLKYGRLIERDRNKDLAIDMFQCTAHAMNSVLHYVEKLWGVIGKPDNVCRKVVQKNEEIYKFKVRSTRYVIVSPGTNSACESLYTTQRCLDMTVNNIIEDKGEVLIFSPCRGRHDAEPDYKGLTPDLESKELFYDNLIKMKDWKFSQVREYIDNNFKLYMWKTHRLLRLMKQRQVKIYLYSELNDNLLANVNIIPIKDYQLWINERIARDDGDFTIINFGNRIIAVNEPRIYTN